MELGTCFNFIDFVISFLFPSKLIKDFLFLLFLILHLFCFFSRYQSNLLFVSFKIFCRVYWLGLQVCSSKHHLGLFPPLIWVLLLQISIPLVQFFLPRSSYTGLVGSSMFLVVAFFFII